MIKTGDYIDSVARRMQRNRIPESWACTFTQFAKGFINKEKRRQAFTYILF